MTVIITTVTIDPGTYPPPWTKPENLILFEDTGKIGYGGKISTVVAPDLPRPVAGSGPCLLRRTV